MISTIKRKGNQPAMPKLYTIRQSKLEICIRKKIGKDTKDAKKLVCDDACMRRRMLMRDIPEETKRNTITPN